MKLYTIILVGCHDSSYILVRLTDSEYKLIKKLSLLSDLAKRYKCCPVLEITEGDTRPEYIKEEDKGGDA